MNNSKSKDLTSENQHNIPIEDTEYEIVLPNKDKQDSNIVKFFKYKSSLAKVSFLIALIIACIILTASLGYFIFTIAYPFLWNWGSNPISWKIIVTLIAYFLIWIIPFFPLIFMGDIIAGVFNLLVEDSETEFSKNLAKAKKEQEKFEQELYEADEEKLLPLISHSRIELEEYYQIGLTQTQKSYKYSILSMWIGLAIIFIGMLFYIFPNNSLNPEIKAGNFEPLLVAIGGVLEIISAIFLVIYKTSLSKLTYFYDRQIFIHNALFAYKISKTMENQDEGKLLIVEKILDFGSKSTEIKNNKI